MPVCVVGNCGSCDACRFKTTYEDSYQRQASSFRVQAPSPSPTVSEITARLEKLQVDEKNRLASTLGISTKSHTNEIAFKVGQTLEVNREPTQPGEGTSVAAPKEDISVVQSEMSFEFVEVKPDLAKKLKETSPKQCVALFYVKQLLHRGCLIIKNSSVGNKSWNWEDASFVKLPISSRYTIAEADRNGRQGVIIPKWKKIQEAFANILLGFKADLYANPDFDQLKDIVSSYHPIKVNEYNFKLLKDPEITGMLKSCLPIIIEHASQLETRLAKPIPILERGMSQTIYLSRNLCCSLLANAFFCTFPERSKDKLPDFNFFRLFHKGENYCRSKVKIEKLKCLLEYFHQMGTCGDEDNTIISFERRSISSHIPWHKTKGKLCSIEVEREKGIEEAEGMLQVDFANKVVGGGVLNEGAVMEEIRFVTSPELIVARLFTETLGNNEVLVVTGTRQFSVYSGYSSTFQYRGGAPPKARKTDNLGREVTQVVVMDAYQFSSRNKSEQYSKEMIDRELHKCYAAFIRRTGNPQWVATGNWGCGAFNGDPELKFFIQWIAASHVERNGLVYHTGGDEKQSQAIERIASVLQEKNATTGCIYQCILKYGQRSNSRISVFEFVEGFLSKPLWRRLLKF